MIEQIILARIVYQIKREVDRQESLPEADCDGLTVVMSPKLYALLMAYHTHMFRAAADGDVTFCGCPVELIANKPGLWYGVAVMREVRE